MTTTNDDATRAVLERYQKIVRCTESKMIGPYEYKALDIDAMAARIVELERDAKRLDWLEARTSFLVHQWEGGGFTLTLPQPPVDGVRPSPKGVQGTTFRVAIDAAIHAEATHD